MAYVAWLMNGGDMVELIETRAKDPKYRNRKIHVSYIRLEKVRKRQ